MRWNKPGVVFSLFSVLIFSCKKDINPIAPIASITVVNASPENQKIVAVISDTTVPFYTNLAPVMYGTALEYTNLAGVTPLILTSEADTTHPIFKGQFDLKSEFALSNHIVAQQITKLIPRIDALLQNIA